MEEEASIEVKQRPDGAVSITMRIGPKSARIDVTPAYAHRLAAALVIAATPQNDTVLSQEIVL